MVNSLEESLEYQHLKVSITDALIISMVPPKKMKIDCPPIDGCTTALLSAAKMDKMLPFIMTWMLQENIMLNRVSQVKKASCNLIHMWNP